MPDVLPVTPAPDAPIETPAEKPSGEAAPAPAETEGEPATPEDDSGDAPAEAADGEAPKPKPKGGFQKRIDQLTRLNGDLARRLEDAVKRLEGNARPAEQPASATDAEPKADDFQSYDDFLVAKAEHKVRQSLKAEQAKAEQAKTEQSFRERELQWEKRKDEAAERYEDFEDVALSEDVPISPAMADTIKDSDKGADLAYWLGSHRDEAVRIAKLSPLAAARELGKIEASLSSPAPRRVSNAPTPPKTVQPKDVGPKPPDKMGMDEYAEARRSGKLK